MCKIFNCNLKKFFIVLCLEQGESVQGRPYFDLFRNSCESKRK